MTALNTANLPIVARSMAVPSYDRSTVRPGIVHFGVGAFHRAHQADYLDQLLSQGHLEWGICGVGALAADSAVIDNLAPQDHLYTLITRDPDSASHTRVIGSLIDFRLAPHDPTGVVEILARPGTRVVSLTITEGGYDAPPPAPGQWDTFRYLVEALRRRRDSGTDPFTVMSCDNVEHNGAVARKAVIEAADRTDTGLAEWINRNVAFPNSMVDRITPATTVEVVDTLRREYGVEDNWPIQSESFTQWVIEDEFTSGRPPLEDVGVSMVNDVLPYEMMKLRLLNASHQIMSYLGLLAGHRYVHEVMSDGALGEFVTAYMREEAAPTLAPVPGVDVPVYIDQLRQRFSSTTISDTLSRQIVDASVRIPKFVLPVIRDRLRVGARIDHAALALAAWCAAYEQSDLTMTDRASDSLRRLAWSDREEPGRWVSNPEVFGDLASCDQLKTAYRQAKTALRELGPRAAAQTLVHPIGRTS